MKIDLEKDFLPVGSIVSIRFSKEKYMIMGFCTIDAKTKKVYDYSAVRYPVGFESLDNVCMFNRLVVKKVHHLGYINYEHSSYIKKIEEVLKNKEMS